MVQSTSCARFILRARAISAKDLSWEEAKDLFFLPFQRRAESGSKIESPGTCKAPKQRDDSSPALPRIAIQSSRFRCRRPPLRRAVAGLVASCAARRREKGRPHLTSRCHATKLPRCCCFHLLNDYCHDGGHGGCCGEQAQWTNRQPPVRYRGAYAAQTIHHRPEHRH